MDGSHSSSRRRRNLVQPSPEVLEGRRLLAAGAAQVRIQEIVTDGVVNLVVTGTRRGDAITIADNGSLAAGNVTVTLGNGKTYTSRKAVSSIQVQGGAGNDRVEYQLTGDLIGPRSVAVSLGSGNDQFSAQVDGAIRTTNILDLEAYGDAGNDSLAIHQSADTVGGTFFPYLVGGKGNDSLAFASTGNVNTGAVVGPALMGGAGNDAITLDYAGQVNGRFLHTLAINGGAGHDRIVSNVAMAADSTGTIGLDSTSPAVIEGGSGNDQIRDSVTIDPTVSGSQVQAVALGNAGKDLVQRSLIVQGDASNENEAILA